MILLDTDVISGMMRAHPAAELEAWFVNLSDRPVVSTISIAELTYGLRCLPPGRRARELGRRFEVLVEAFELVGLDAQTAERSGEFRASRKALGRPLAFADAMIAATAAMLEARLATRNTRDFQGLGLSLVNPWSS